MVKSKGSKKSKSKGRGKKKRDSEDVKEEISEVDKEHFQILVSDLQGQLAKLTERCDELENENDEVVGKLHELDEERADIIAFLRRQLDEKSGEATELSERLEGLKRARADEANSYEARLATLEREARLEKEQLTAELRLLQGKLGSLEEFRAQREDLNAKFARQEEERRENERRHEHELHEAHKNFVLSKDRLKREMEQQLVRLSSDFQAATSLRMAATTQQAVRENAALQAEVLKTRRESLRWRTALANNEERVTKLRRELELNRDLELANIALKMTPEKVVVHTGVQTFQPSSRVSISEVVKVAVNLDPEEDSTPDDLPSSSYDESSGSSTERGPVVPSYRPGSLGFVG